MRYQLALRISNVLRISALTYRSAITKLIYILVGEKELCTGRSISLAS